MSPALVLKRCLPVLISILSFHQTFSQLVPTIREAKKDPKEDVFTKVDVKASFPGGNKAWVKYVSNAFDSTDFSDWEHKDQGTCRVRFIINKNGTISDVHAINMKGTRLAKLAEEIIMKSPQWKPARYKGKPVNAYHQQPITVTLMNTLPE